MLLKDEHHSQQMLGPFRSCWVFVVSQEVDVKQEMPGPHQLK